MAELAVSPVLRALPVSDRGIRRIGLLILFLTFVLFGGWAALAPLESAALAPGVVKVKNYRKTIQHLEGGIVSDILVREGSAVRAGDPLIELDATQYRAERQLLRGQYLSLRALEARLLAERAGLEAVQYPAELLAGGEARIAEAVASQNAVFEAGRNARAGERAVLEQRVEQLQSQIEGIRAVYNSNQQLIASYETEMAELRVLL
jgi:epimerase transport system membrane fusion protein